jgi:diadenosine tetraphosphatase ApaH/serine/threonine PP2A family protein phosphatase
LLALKYKYSDRVFVLRGNREFAHINALYGFYDRVMTNYHIQERLSRFQDVFAYLPFAAVVGSQIFCVHGGLSRGLKSLDQIAATPMRVVNYFDNRMVADLVWSDPEGGVAMFADGRRGSGMVFGTTAVKKFLKTVGLKLMIRSHQCIADGFMLFDQNCGLIVFSSSEYCRQQHHRCGVTHVHPDGTIALYSFSGDWTSSARKTVMTLAPDLGVQQHFLRNGAACGRKKEAVKGADVRQATAPKRAPRNGRRPLGKLSTAAER